MKRPCRNKSVGSVLKEFELLTCIKRGEDNK